MDLNYTPLLAVMVSAVLAFIAYLNYRLNKTLNIKNQLHNEKVKLYRDLIKAILDIIAIMDKGNRIVLSNEVNDKGLQHLPALADKIDDKARSFHNLMIESYMVVPDHIAELLTEFSDFILTGINTDFPSEYSTQLEKVDNKTREMAELLIAAFRKDLGTSKLNHKLGRN